MTIKRTYSLIGITALLVCFAVIFFSRQKSYEGKVFLHAEAVQTVYGWGYNIYTSKPDENGAGEEKIYIKQEFIPAVPGKKGFKSADEALLVGNLVIKKISSGLPPTITIRDLDSLGLIKNEPSH
jgi:hypothetical protein